MQRWLDSYRPEVALYFAGPAKDVYQANMWLAPTEALDQRAVVLMRSREAFNELADTRLPVICVPAGVDFMNLELGSVRAALYAANVGANIHMLREPGMKHVFVGHGDSDKQASVNPYSKVYDEVWVAGLAGRERYARAGVGVLRRGHRRDRTPATRRGAHLRRASRSTGRSPCCTRPPGRAGWTTTRTTPRWC